MVQPRKSWQTGFSLAELLVALAILALVAVVISQMVATLKTSRIPIRAEAEKLAELLRGLRQQAISEGRPVGLGLPRQGGSRTVCSGYYLLEGEVRPKIVRSLALKSLQLSGCQWPELPFQLASGPNLSGSNLSHSNYSLNRWEPPYPQDGLLMFLPSGELLSNLSTHQGQVALVLSQSIAARSLSGGGQSLVELQAAHSPYVIWCSILGEIRLEAGISGAPSRVSALAVSSTPAGLPPLTTASNRPPVLLTAPGQSSPLQVSPPPNRNTLARVAAGSSATLRQDRYVSLKVTARDPDGDSLYCRWTSVGKLGAFTKGEQEDDLPMRYEPAHQLWTATWAWQPPPGLNHTHPPFLLDAIISDHRGGETKLSGVISGGGKFSILAPGRLAFTRGQDSWIANWDGSDPVIVAQGLTSPRWSPGGQMICCRGPQGELVVLNQNGSSRRTLRPGPALTSPGSFSRDGTQVRFLEQVGQRFQIQQASPWLGSPGPWLQDERDLLRQFPSDSRPVLDCHPLKDLVVVSRTEGSAGNIVLVSGDDSNTPDRSLALQGYDASFTYSGDLVYRTPAGQLAKYPLTGGTPIIGTVNEAKMRLPRMSGDGKYLVFQAQDGGKDNCYLLFDCNTLGSSARLFDFPEDCREPDWAD